MLLTGIYTFLDQIVQNAVSNDTSSNNAILTLWDLDSICSSAIDFYEDSNSDIFERGLPVGNQLMAQALRYFSDIFSEIVLRLSNDKLLETLEGVDIIYKSQQIWALFLEHYSLSDESKLKVQALLINATSMVFLLA